MEIKGIIELLENQKELKKQEIENMEDVYETLDYIIDKLKDCQERIIDRNSIISDL